jgi:hypothetical protein
VPELPRGGEDPLGHHALRFTAEYAGGARRYDPVAVPDGDPISSWYIQMTIP